MKNHENIKYPAKYEVLIKQYLRSILDISVMWKTRFETEAQGKTRKWPISKPCGRDLVILELTSISEIPQKVTKKEKIADIDSENKEWKLESDYTCFADRTRSRSLFIIVSD